MQAAIMSWIRSRDPKKFLSALFISGYFLYLTSHPLSNPFILHGVNLVFHEAGHAIFFFFGTFISIAGGSFLQIAIPLVCIGYFFIQKKLYSASVLLFWLSYSILDVSVYAADAISMRLPLLGGESTIHDWNYLLSTLGLIQHTDTIAHSLKLLAVLILFAAIVCSLQTAKKQA